jgi:carboxyl-terminal processing protease
VVATPEEDTQLSLQRSRPERDNLAEFKERFGFTPIEDRQLQAALDVLQGVRVLAERNGPNAGGPTR